MWVTIEKMAVAVSGTHDTNIVHANVVMPDGHRVTLFVNRDTNLVVVDYTHKNEKGGNELLRKTLNPVIMLAHCVKRGKK